MGTAVAEIGTGTPPGAAVELHRGEVSLLRPIAKPAAVLAAQNETRALIREALVEGRDYGKIPGTDKPTLYKPGAEKIALAFGCYFGPPVMVEQEVDHFVEVPWVKRKKTGWDPDKKEAIFEETSGTSIGLYRYVTRVDVIHRATGEIVGSCIGVCSTLESKYVDRPRDTENTVLKMSQKRGLVGATLLAFGLSDEFTQDMEDVSSDEVQRAPAGAARSSSRSTGGARGASAKTPPCPKCGGPMWDNTDRVKSNLAAGKKTGPLHKCKQKGGDPNCDGVIWPTKEDQAALQRGEELGAAPAAGGVDPLIRLRENVLKVAREVETLQKSGNRFSPPGPVKGAEELIEVYRGTEDEETMLRQTGATLVNQRTRLLKAAPPPPEEREPEPEEAPDYDPLANPFDGDDDLPF